MFAKKFETRLSLRWKSPHTYNPCMCHRSTKMVTGHHASAFNLLLFGMFIYMHNIERDRCFTIVCIHHVLQAIVAMSRAVVQL